MTRRAEGACGVSARLKVKERVGLCEGRAATKGIQSSQHPISRCSVFYGPRANPRFQVQGVPFQTLSYGANVHACVMMRGVWALALRADGAAQSSVPSRVSVRSVCTCIAPYYFIESSAPAGRCSDSGSRFRAGQRAAMLSWPVGLCKLRP